MERLALLARLAKPGKEKEEENFLKSGLLLAEQESKTNTWFGLKIGTFNIRYF
jgi:hypothetical protein